MRALNYEILGEDLSPGTSQPVRPRARCSHALCGNRLSTTLGHLAATVTLRCGGEEGRHEMNPVPGQNETLHLLSSIDVVPPQRRLSAM
jgi:hypothetical protein